MAVTRALALEWGLYGITCNAVSPTVVMTPMSREYWQGERAKKKLERIPTGSFGRSLYGETGRMCGKYI